MNKKRNIVLRLKKKCSDYDKEIELQEKLLKKSL